jgi:hypothetical protein
MKTSTTTSNFWLITGLILSAVIFRIITNAFSLFNFTPVIAVALFSGAKFQQKKWALLIPVIALFVSDVILAYLNNFAVLHDTIFFTYGAVLLVILLGRYLNSENLNISKTALFSVVSSFLFFVITNTGVWMFSHMFTYDVAGLTKCYIVAIPFLQRSIFGDLFFTGVLFGVYELVIKNYYSKSNDVVWQKNNLID